MCVKLGPFPDSVPSAKAIKGNNISLLRRGGWRNKPVKWHDKW